MSINTKNKNRTAYFDPKSFFFNTSLPLPDSVLVMQYLYDQILCRHIRQNLDVRNRPENSTLPLFPAEILMANLLLSSG